MECKPLEYLLPAGALLYDVVNMDSARAMSNANIREELALYHLATNPGCEKQFSRLPEDWKERVEVYKQRVQLNHKELPEKTKSTAKPKAKRTTKKSTEKTND